MSEKNAASEARSTFERTGNYGHLAGAGEYVLGADPRIIAGSSSEWCWHLVARGDIHPSCASVIPSDEWLKSQEDPAILAEWWACVDEGEIADALAKRIGELMPSREHFVRVIGRMVLDQQGKAHHLYGWAWYVWNEEERKYGFGRVKLRDPEPGRYLPNTPSPDGWVSLTPHETGTRATIYRPRHWVALQKAAQRRNGIDLRDWLPNYKQDKRQFTFDAGRPVTIEVKEAIAEEVESLFDMPDSSDVALPEGAWRIACRPANHRTAEYGCLVPADRLSAPNGAAFSFIDGGVHRRYTVNAKAEGNYLLWHRHSRSGSGNTSHDVFVALLQEGASVKMCFHSSSMGEVIRTHLYRCVRGALVRETT